jgi:hypothetical protein
MLARSISNLLFPIGYQCVTQLHRCHDTFYECVLVARVPRYKSRGPGFDSRNCQIF